MEPFILDGKTYNVAVTGLTRKFTVPDSGLSGRMQNGDIFRDPVGTYYNYTMRVVQRGGDAQALDGFWEAISQPVRKHICVFPYGQQTLTQEMYVISGAQPLIYLSDGIRRWGELSVDFIAASPRVTP